MLESQIEVMKEMYLEGYTLKEIALKLTGIENHRRKVSFLLKENGVDVSYFKFNCNHSFFEKINTEEKAYWLGFIYADGYIRTDNIYNTGKLGIALSVKDKDHLEKFKLNINATHHIKTYISKTKYNEKTIYSRIIITSKQIVDDLINVGVFPNKTEKLTFPIERIVPNTLLNHFIRGYMDGDGSIIEPKSKKYQLSFCGTKEFLEGIQKALDLNLKLMKRHKNNVNNWSLVIAGNNQVERLLDYIYKDSTIYLQRKFTRYINLKTLNYKK